MRIVSVVLVLAALLLTGTTGWVDVDVVRTGDENPLATVSQYVLWGGTAGLVLGATWDLATEHWDAEILKWSFVGGTCIGLIYGIYYVSTRPDASTALLQLDSSGSVTGGRVLTGTWLQ